jgi:hypothetical protein
MKSNGLAETAILGWSYTGQGCSSAESNALSVFMHSAVSRSPDFGQCGVASGQKGQMLLKSLKCAFRI